MWKGILLAAAASLLLTVPAAAHEEGVVRLSVKQVEPGGGLEVRGEKMPKRAIVELALRGGLATYSLGQLATDSMGFFVGQVSVPVTAQPGSYRLVVVGADGDALARADLAILAALPPLATDEAAPGGDDMARSAATDEMMPLDLRFSTGETSAIGVLLLMALGGGFMLLRRPRRA